MLTRAPLKRHLIKVAFLKSLMKTALLLVALVCVGARARAQTAAPASVAGRVTEGERGVGGVSVLIMPADPSTRFRTIARGRTDAEGRYRISNVQPGRYQISLFAPLYVVQDAADNWPPGKPLNLSAGEEVADIDFRVERGGVITGRVTDADGNPVIAEQVVLTSADKDKPFNWRGFTDPRALLTDDRGVYRLYGLPPGRYRVSVGASEEGGSFGFGRRKVYRRTFYPDATEEADARVVELAPGGEATDVDITVGRALKTYRASGRFVMADTNEPVPNVPVGYGLVAPDGRRISTYGGGGAVSNARGEFQTDGLAPGHYAVFAFTREDSEFYSDAAVFDIKDSEVQGLVVRLRRGVSVSGVVRLEGVNDRATAARLLSGLRLYAFVERNAQTLAPDYGRAITVGADGNFRIGGLRAGKLRFSLADPRAGALTLTRVEVNGANASGGIDLADGAQLAGVRLVLAYGSGVVRGQVNYANGTPPAGARVIAFARRVLAVNDDAGGRTVEVDSRGRFILEGLAAGEYEVRARVFYAGALYQSNPQRVSLAEGGEMNVTLSIDFTAPYNRGGRP